MTSLRDRLPPQDTIAEFEAARFDRYQDGLILDVRGRRLGAMYLLGYFAEMTLKSAFFLLRGFRTDEGITGAKLRAAARMAANDLRVSVDPEGYHGLHFWALAIIALRDHIGEPLPPEIALELNWRSQRMNSHWTSSMRYSRDITTPEDWASLWEDAQWLDSQYYRLIAATAE